MHAKCADASVFARPNQLAHRETPFGTGADLRGVKKGTGTFAALRSQSPISAEVYRGRRLAEAAAKRGTGTFAAYGASPLFGAAGSALGWVVDRGRELRDGPEPPARVARLDDSINSGDQE